MRVSIPLPGWFTSRPPTDGEAARQLELELEPLRWRPGAVEAHLKAKLLETRRRSRWHQYDLRCLAEMLMLAVPKFTPPPARAEADRDSREASAAYWRDFKERLQSCLEAEAS